MRKSTCCALLTFYLLFILSGVSYAQERTIEGFVSTFDSIPLIKAEIKVLSTKQTTLTDSLGQFEVSCSFKDKIKVSAYGFATRKVKLNEKTKIVFVNLSLKPGVKNSELAIGYGHVSDRDKLVAISSLQSEKDNFSNYSDMYQLIRGSFPGVQVKGKDIIIRGANSVNNSGTALIVVDGAMVDSGVLDRISPFDVKSIDVLKDGASAIYGTRGTNGVVLITTKKGGE